MACSAWGCSSLSREPIRSASWSAAVARARSAHVSACGLGERVIARSIACSLARTASVVIRPPSNGSTRRSATIAFVLGERVSWREFAGGLLEQHGTQLARLERRGVLGQSFFDAILERSLRTRTARLLAVAALARKAVAYGLLVPHALQVRAGDGELGLAVLQLEPAQLAALGCSPPLRAEPLGRRGDFAAARRERLDQPAAARRRSRSTGRPCPSLS